jgi:hypothetical protein
MSLSDALKQGKPPGCARQRAGFGHGPMKEACTLEACAPRRFPEEERCYFAEKHQCHLYPVHRFP